MDVSDPDIRADQTFEICVFELVNAATDPPDFSKLIPCYILTNPSLVEIQRFWFDPGRANGMASYAVMEELGAQYLEDFRQSTATQTMFLMFYRDTSQDMIATAFNYDDPRGGVWVLKLEREQLEEYEEAAMSGAFGEKPWKLDEKFGAQYYTSERDCPELEDAKRESACWRAKL